MSVYHGLNEFAGEPGHGAHDRSLLLVRTERADKEYCVLLCHEGELKHHEIQLLDGYRHSTWSAGWPHISEDQRRKFSTRIGTVTWGEIADEWPALRELPELQDLPL